MEDLTFEVTTRWSGSGREAMGTVETGDQVLAWSVPSGMGGRGEGSSPEELLASAVATCYTGTLSSLLSRDGLPWERVQVRMQETVVGQPTRISSLLATPASWAGIPAGWRSTSAPRSWPGTTASSAATCAATLPTRWDR